MTEAVDPVHAPTEVSAQEATRERSTIAFPYLSLDIAVEIVKAVHATGGQQSQMDQVAAQMNESANGGAFRTKVVTARIFGLVKYSTGTITLTPLGSRVTDPDQEKIAKADAFLHVPLYRRVYDDFKGLVLPPTPAALEAVMVSMGVSPKQKDKARQAFQRSAQQAGFFAYGTTKLVYPALGGEAKPRAKEKIEEPNEKPAATNGSGAGGGNGGGPRHPLIEGLLKELPEPQTEWTTEERKNWLEMASTIFNVIYKNSDDSRGSLRVVVEKASAK
ncbi:MAG: hypothetical protein ACYCOR_13160 [Acidobacteriaceae bacterium]